VAAPAASVLAAASGLSVATAVTETSGITTLAGAAKTSSGASVTARISRAAGTINTAGVSIAAAVDWPVGETVQQAARAEHTRQRASTNDRALGWHRRFRRASATAGTGRGLRDDGGSERTWITRAVANCCSRSAVLVLLSGTESAVALVGCGLLDDRPGGATCVDRRAYTAVRHRGQRDYLTGLC
jgi:hypothetical protein